MAMIEAVSGAGVSSASTLWADPGQAAALEPPDPHLVVHFEEMVAADGLRVAQADPNVAGAIADGWVQPLPGPAEALPAPSFSDTMADTLQGVREEWTHIRAEMVGLQSAPGDNTAQMLALVTEMAHVNVTVTMLVQEMKAFSSAIGQLMKAQ